MNFINILGSTLIERKNINIIKSIIDLEMTTGFDYNVYKLLLENDIDIRTIKTELNNDPRLSELTKPVTNVKGACLLYLEKYKRKELLRMVEEAKYQLNNEKNKLSDIGSFIIKKSRELTNVQSDFNKTEASMEYIKMVEGIRNGSIKFIPTGLKRLDDLIYGFVNSEIIIIGARPTVGKTSLALTIAYNQSFLYGIKTRFYSIEMGSNALLNSLIGISKGITTNEIMKGEITDQQLGEINQFLVEFDKGNLDIVPELSELDLIISDIELSDADVFYIDYIQDLKVKTNQRETIEEAMTEFKQLAKRINKPIVILSQINRVTEDNKDKRPYKHNLKGSGRIEEAGDKIILIHNEVDQFEMDTYKLLIEKNKQGATGEIHINFDKRRLKFYD